MCPAGGNDPGESVTLKLPVREVSNMQGDEQFFSISVSHAIFRTCFY